MFNKAFGFNVVHVGPIGRTPDVLILSDADNYQAIIDNKACSKYSISNDHHSRIVNKYIRGIGGYNSSDSPLAFYSYISGGFATTIDQQLNRITEETAIPGSAVTVSNMITMVHKHSESEYSHTKIREIFLINRKVLISDL